MHTTRKQFLHSSVAVIATAFFASAFSIKKQHPKLCFSTLGCPDWDFDTIVKFAVKHKYNGLEIRGILRELDLVKCKEFATPQNRLATTQLMKENNLQFAGLGSSVELHFTPGTQRQKNMDEGRRFIDLAHQINCPNVRVFPNFIPKGQDRTTTMDLIASGLLELGKHASGTKVNVLMETHGDVVKITDIEKIMHAAQHPDVGLVWDICNMWTMTKEPPAEAYKKLKKYIRHTHIKDAKMEAGKLKYTLLGQGEVPIFEAINILKNDDYKGFYSFEWEKLWHPEIEDPALAIAQFPPLMLR